MSASRIDETKPFSETESREVYPWEVRGFEGSLRALQSMGQEAICTPPGEPQVRPQCAEINDDLCQTLWSNKNRGSMKVADGAIAAGQSSKSEMAASRIEDLQALIASESKLPPDLKAKAKPIFAELKTLLKKERDSKDWYRGISLALFKWETTVMDTASARTEAKHRPLKQIKQSDLSIEQKALYQSDLHHIQSEILEAKYKRHPNWKAGVEGVRIGPAGHDRGDSKSQSARGTKEVDVGESEVGETHAPVRGSQKAGS